jgi:outer membrane protein assembly factor BamB
MTQQETISAGKEKDRQALPRLWPGIATVCVQWTLWFLVPRIWPEYYLPAVAGGVLGGALVLAWWLFFSRLPLMDRWAAFLFCILVTVAVFFLLDPSIATGNMGFMYPMHVIPNTTLALVLGTLLGYRLPVRFRRLVLAALILIASTLFLFLRSDGLNGSGMALFNWRWAETSEEQLLAGGKELNDPAAVPADKEGMMYWPGFRGPARNSTVNHLDIETDWKKHPPELLWKNAVGPGCSSFAVQGDRVYTQEQRGEHEMVSCYSLSTGQAIWMHRDETRFWDSHAGAGPRATPMIQGDRVYSLGGSGILNALDATSGSPLWSRNAASDFSEGTPDFGFSASPLVVDDVMIIALAGKLIAYDAVSGEVRWEGPDEGANYSSPQLFRIEGIPQLLFMSRNGLISVDAATGKTHWKYDWETAEHILQPALTDRGDLLLTEETKALRCIRVSREGEAWKLTEKWTSDEMKLNFNDFVVHKGHAYGFDGPSLACLDPENGTRTWKGARYRGWMLLLADQDLLLILTEKGSLALVEARPDRFSELATFPALEGRTWNHPALAGNILLVRNSEEMAAIRLPLR